MATVVKTKPKHPPKRKYTFSQLEHLWIKNGGSKKLAPTMAAIALAESHGNINARHVNSNGSVDQGLWQINSSNQQLYRGKNIFNPNVNAHAAIQLAEHSGNGLKNWTTYTSGTYAQYLPGGKKWGWIGVVFNPNNPKLKSPGGKSGALNGVTSAVEHPVRSVQQAGNAVVNKAESPIVSTLQTGLKDAGFAVVILGGGALILLGILLVGADLAIPAFSSMRNGKTFSNGQRLARIPAHKRARKVAATRSAELHGQKVRMGEARIKTEQARATELRSRSRHRATLARQTKAQKEQEHKKAMYEGAIAANTENLQRAREANRRRKAA